ncbi:MAG TPA: hypothetical protein VGR35_21865 [Tepidisphaeraceae bacterium]|nr:hypothetical protein [Tepidisphaeraceae bacterium]
MPNRKKNVIRGKPSAQEMAYEPPAEVDFSTGLVFHGMKEWRRYISWKRGYVKLDPDLRKLLPDDRKVNQILRNALALRKVIAGEKKRRSA